MPFHRIFTALASQDPSSEKFCYYQTGSSEVFAKQEAVCNALADGGVFNTLECQAEFCAAGSDGYVAFANNFMDWVRGQIVPVVL